jgi:hypothetical protein
MLLSPRQKNVYRQHRPKADIDECASHWLGGDILPWTGFHLARERWGGPTHAARRNPAIALKASMQEQGRAKR